MRKMTARCRGFAIWDTASASNAEVLPPPAPPPIIAYRAGQERNRRCGSLLGCQMIGRSLFMTAFVNFAFRGQKRVECSHEHKWPDGSFRGPAHGLRRAHDCAR